MSLKIVVALSISSAAIVAILVSLGIPAGQSAVFNHSWSVHYSAAFAPDNPFPRHLPGLWAGFGGHDFFFYGPLPFWAIAALIEPLCPGCAAAAEFVLGSALFLVLSGITCFWFLRSFFAPGAAAFGAACYVIAPYHLFLDWFERQAVGEFTAYSFLPLIALGIERIRRDGGGGWILTLGVAGTALSHLPTALLAGHVFGVVCIAFVISARDDTLKRVALLGNFAWFGGLGLLLSGFYWLPAIVLLDTVSAALLFDVHFEAWRWLIGAGSGPPGERIFLLVVLCFLTALPILLASFVYARGAVLLWILLPVALAVILNLSLSEPLWKNWIIAKVQFPWRLMAFVDLATAVAAAALAARMIDLRRGVVPGMVLMVAAIPFAIISTSIEYAAPEGSAVTDEADWVGATEYLSPETAEAVRIRLGKDRLTYFDLERVIETFDEIAAEFRATGAQDLVLDRRPRSVTVMAQPGQPTASVPVQYWFLWEAETAEGRPLGTQANPRFGTLDVLAPEGGFDGRPIVVRLSYHQSEKLGLGLSVLGLVLLLVSSLWMRRLAHGGPGRAPPEASS